MTKEGTADTRLPPCLEGVGSRCAVSCGEEGRKIGRACPLAAASTLLPSGGGGPHLLFWALSSRYLHSFAPPPPLTLRDGAGIRDYQKKIKGLYYINIFYRDIR